MIGFVLITHAAIGAEMIHAVEEILKEKTQIVYIPMNPASSQQEMQEKIQKGIESHRDKQGVIILTDLYGATPANLCGSFYASGKVEIVTGCNLPMLLKAASTPFEMKLENAAEFIKNYGCENIRIYSTTHHES